jgi:hypothetical protein
LIIEYLLIVKAEGEAARAALAGERPLPHR